MKHLLEKYKKNETSEEENQNIEHQVMAQFFAKQERERWGAMLAAEGITRNSVRLENESLKLTGVVTAKPSKMRIWWAAAASIALLIGVAILLPSQPARKVTANLQQKADSYLQQGRVSTQTRMGSGSGLPADQIWEVAKNAYTEGNFDKAIAEIEKIGEDISAEQRYYLAQAYVAKENFPKAIENLSKVAKQDGLWSSEARWCLALAYIKNNQPDLAKPILATFLHQNWRKQQAQELLDEIK
jgi:tetratricopeptide (TPR) repeat protein